MAALAVVLVAVLAVGIRFVMSRLNQHDQAAREVPTNLYSPVACKPEMVETAIAPREATAGQAVVFDVTLHNKSTTNPCYIDVGWSNLRVDITSGSAHVASIAECKAGPENKQLLLDRGYATKLQVTWPGGVSASGCGNDGDAAKPGTYVAALSFRDETAATSKKPFALN